jgi:hypothetical protein
MLRASRWFRVGSPVLWFAAIAGALLGALMTRPRARACECVPPKWRLTLVSESTSGEVVHAWPAVAHLEARPGTVVITSEDMTTQTIDHLHAGEP